MAAVMSIYFLAFSTSCLTANGNSLPVFVFREFLQEDCLICAASKLNMNSNVHIVNIAIEMNVSFVQAKTRNGLFSQTTWVVQVINISLDSLRAMLFLGTLTTPNQLIPVFKSR
jgi:hypothetical protein